MTQTNMETNFQIPTGDGHILYGKINAKEKSSKLVIFAHGLTGNMNEHHYFNAVPFFTEAGFEVCRFNFYSSGENARTLSECTIPMHARDLELVINKFADEYEELYLVGHSLASPVILRTDVSKINKIVLWDPSAGYTEGRGDEFYFIEEIGKFVKKGRLEVLMSKEMFDVWGESSDLDGEVQRIIKPTKFIFAGNHTNKDFWMKAIEKDERHFEVAVVEGATHVFHEEGTEKVLHEETLAFLK